MRHDTDYKDIGNESYCTYCGQKALMDMVVEFGNVRWVPTCDCEGVQLAEEAKKINRKLDSLKLIAETKLELETAIYTVKRLQKRISQLSI